MRRLSVLPVVAQKVPRAIFSFCVNCFSAIGLFLLLIVLATHSPSNIINCPGEV